MGPAAIADSNPENLAVYCPSIVSLTSDILFRAFISDSSPAFCFSREARLAAFCLKCSASLAFFSSW